MVLRKGQELLRLVDIFSVPVYLTLNNQKKIKTPFGGMLSLLMIFACLCGLADQILVILKASFTESSTTYSALDVGEYSYNVSKDQFVFAIKIQSHVAEVNDTNIAEYFSIVYVQESYSNDGTQNLTYYTSKQCNTEKYSGKGIVQKALTELEDAWRCIDFGHQPQVLQLQGFAGTSKKADHKQFYAIVGTCESLQTITNATCKPQHQSLSIAEFMQSQSLSYAQLSNPYQYISRKSGDIFPINRGYMSNGLLTSLTQVRAIEIQISLTEYYLGWFFASLTTESNQYAGIADSYLQVYNQTGIKKITPINFECSVIYQFSLADTYISEQYSRYTVVQQLSVFGGLVYSIMGGLGAINSFISNYSVDNHLLRKLYSVNINDTEFFRKKAKDDQHFDGKLSSFYQIMNDRTSVHFTLSNMLCYLFFKPIKWICCKSKPVGAEKVFLKARERLYMEIDLVQILRQLRISHFLFQLQLKQYQIDLVPYFSRYCVTTNNQIFDKMAKKPGQYVNAPVEFFKQRSKFKQLSKEKDFEEETQEEQVQHWFEEMFQEVDQERVARNIELNLQPCRDQTDQTIVKEVCGLDFDPIQLQIIREELEKNDEPNDINGDSDSDSETNSQDQQKDYVSKKSKSVYARRNTQLLIQPFIDKK